jgi:hypothetical protein
MKKAVVHTYDRFVGDISVLIETARRKTVRSINAILTATYWEIGRRIVEFEQAPARNERPMARNYWNACHSTSRRPLAEAFQGETFNTCGLFTSCILQRKYGRQCLPYSQKRMESGRRWAVFPVCSETFFESMT